MSNYLEALYLFLQENKVYAYLGEGYLREAEQARLRRKSLAEGLSPEQRSHLETYEEELLAKSAREDRALFQAALALGLSLGNLGQ